LSQYENQAWLAWLTMFYKINHGQPW